jgi:Ca2+-binding RTX toxin-like protein
LAGVAVSHATRRCRVVAASSSGAGNDAIFSGYDGPASSPLPANYDGSLEAGRSVGDANGNDTLAGGLGSDIVRGDLNNKDVQNSQTGADVLYGGAGNDMIGGKGGDDTLYGEGGDDQLWGDNGNDYLDGGTGTDRLHGDDDSGGTGYDTGTNGETYIKIELIIQWNGKQPTKPGLVGCSMSAPTSLGEGNGRATSKGCGLSLILHKARVC